MKSLLIGTVRFSRTYLEHLIARRSPPIGVVTKGASAFHADSAPLGDLCEQAGIPCHYATNVNDPETVEWIRERWPDVTFCFG